MSNIDIIDFFCKKQKNIKKISVEKFPVVKGRNTKWDGDVEIKHMPVITRWLPCGPRRPQQAVLMRL